MSTILSNNDQNRTLMTSERQAVRSFRPSVPLMDGAARTTTMASISPEHYDKELSQLEMTYKLRNQQGVIPWRPARDKFDPREVDVSNQRKHIRQKDQRFYGTCMKEDNQWNNPVHAGPKTWTTYFGPSLAARAEMLGLMQEATDRLAQERADKEFFEGCRIECKIRLLKSKERRRQLVNANQWVPQGRSKVEMQNCNAWEEFASMPLKTAVNEITPLILRRDKEAVVSIMTKIATEKQWDDLYALYRRQGRLTTLAKFNQRRLKNRELQDKSKQLLVTNTTASDLVNKEQMRLQKLQEAYRQQAVKNYGEHVDGEAFEFNGLCYADKKICVERVMPVMPEDVQNDNNRAMGFLTKTFKSRWNEREYQVREEVPSTAETAKEKAMKREKMKQVVDEIDAFEDRMEYMIDNQPMMGNAQFKIDTTSRHGGKYSHTNMDTMKESLINDYVLPDDFEKNHIFRFQGCRALEAVDCFNVDQTEAYKIIHQQMARPIDNDTNDVENVDLDQLFYELQNPEQTRQDVEMYASNEHGEVSSESLDHHAGGQSQENLHSTYDNHGDCQYGEDDLMNLDEEGFQRLLAEQVQLQGKLFDDWDTSKNNNNNNRNDEQVSESEY